ncbi:penicillin-binding protein 2 [Kribbella sp. NPDC048915]|uniref:penicillin-binding protein 2 n=1 Tax=Kribbella sp. NPDC048915 TaxID=3155148 RepID=UPI0033F7DFBA
MRTATRSRLLGIQVLILSLVAALGLQLAYSQVVAGDRYQDAAADNGVREVVTPAVRGLILDARGRPLVRNRSRLVISIDRSALERQPDRGDAVLARLASLLGRPVSELRRQIRPCGPGITKPCWSGSPYRPVPVLDDAPLQAALQIMERREQFPAVRAEVVAAREYPAPAGARAVHLLGYLQPADEQAMAAQRARGRRDPELQRADLVGRAGLEKQYDEVLRGTPGTTRLVVDHAGRVTGRIDEVAPVPGSHLVTSIDADVQAVAEQELLAAIKRARGEVDRNTGRRYAADAGAVVVMDVHTGRVLAMASYPIYDPQIWEDGISMTDYRRLVGEQTGAPLLSRAFQGGGAPPGSTFKPISVAAAVAAGFPLGSKYPCPSSLRIGGRQFRNFESRGYGDITLARAIEVSCDTVFYGIAERLWRRDGGNRPVAQPADALQRMARSFGLGEPTGVDLPGESPGRIADRDHKRRSWERTKHESCRRASSGYPELARTDPARARFLKELAKENCADGFRWRVGDAVNFAIGQGDTLVTPLQLARTYAAIANGGTLWRPQVARAVIGPDGRVATTFEPEATGRLPLSRNTLSYLRNALTGVTTRGSAAWRFAGWPHDKYPVAAKTGTAEVFGKQTTSWFATFAPADKPRYAVVMTVSQGGTGTGSGAAAPSVRGIYEALFGIGRPPVLPGGVPSASLPPIRPNGTVGGR